MGAPRAVLTIAVVGILVAATASGSVYGQSCEYQPGGRPDPHCTPGAVDPRVTQDNIHETICTSGYTTRARWSPDGQLLWPGDEGYPRGEPVRPSSAYTNRLKDQGLVDYGVATTPQDARALRAAFEEDHLISLGIGGAPRDPSNLWPEPWAGGDNAREKDRVETFCRAAVCAARIPLAEAQRQMAEDWHTACQSSSLFPETDA